jgi:cellulose synthase operon protein C
LLHIRYLELTVVRFPRRGAVFFRAFLLLFALFWLSGCGVWDFISAYFNTYYNAQRLYSEAEEEIWALPEMKNAGRNLLVPFVAQPGTKTKFTSVIEKFSKLLQYHPDSKLVDDALLMIGNSFYYQGEFQRAQRKYTELIETHPQSDFVLHAKALLSYCYYKMEQPDSARSRATALLALATEEGEDDVIAEASLLLGQLDYEAKAYERSRTYFESVADLGDTPGKRAHAYFKIALIDSAIGDYGGSVKAFKKAGNESDTYVGEFRGQFGMARMLRLQEEYGASLDELKDLRDNANFREFLGDIELQIGHVYRDRGDFEDAIEQYAYVDTAFARTEQSALSSFERGLIFETRFFLYDSAKEEYSRGRGQFPTAPITQELTRRAEYLTRYFTYRNEIARLDSLLAVALVAPDTLRARADTLAADSLHAALKDSIQRSVPSLDTLAHAAKDTTARTVPDTMLVAPETLAQHAPTASPPNPAPLRTPQQQGPGMSPDSIRTRLAGSVDDLANLFYASMDQPDSSRFWYERLVSDFPKNPRVPRALYTLALIARRDTVAGSQRADSLLREIAERFPDTPFGEEALRLLGRPPIPGAVDDAGMSYERATRLMLAGSYVEAVDSFKSVVSRFPGSSYASKSQYAVGWIYEFQTPTPDSAVANYERLVQLYPTSEFSARVQPKLAEVHAARAAAAQKAVQDSIAAAQKAIQDSIASAPKTAQDSVASTGKTVRDSTATAPGLQPEQQTPPTPPPETPEQQEARRAREAQAQQDARRTPTPQPPKEKVPIE